MLLPDQLLQQLSLSSEPVGEALVSHYTQLLPHLTIYLLKMRSVVARSGAGAGAGDAEGLPDSSDVLDR